jgi:hypothetical protein
MNQEEAQKQVSENNAALLLVRKPGAKKSEILDTVSAGKLLGLIELASTGQGGVQISIPRNAVEQSGVKIENWEKAKKNGMLREVQLNGKTHFTMPQELDAGKFHVANTLIDHLVTIAGISHEDARKTAAKFASTPAEGKAR